MSITVEKAQHENINVPNELKDEEENKYEDQQMVKTSIKTYVSEDAVYTAFTYIFFIYCLVTVITFGVILGEFEQFSEIAVYIYYSGQLFYQTCVIIVSYFSLKDTFEVNVKHHSATWYELIFYVKFFFCSLFHLISFVLLCCGIASIYNSSYHHDKAVFVLMAVADLLSIISIPFPGIVLFKFDHLKKNVSVIPKVSKIRSHSVSLARSQNTLNASMSLSITSGLLSETIANKSPYTSAKSPYLPVEANMSFSNYTSSPSTASHLDMRKNHFFEKEMMAAMCSVYGIHFLVYMITPSVAKQSFQERITLMYDLEISADFRGFIYTANHVFLRTFYGMCLNGLFFAFFAMVVARDQEMYYVKGQNELSDFELVKKLIQKQWKFSLLITVLVLFSIVPEICGYFECAFVGDTLSNSINFIWIGINFIGIGIAIGYKYLFSGAYRKYTQRKISRFGNENGVKKVDNIPYGLKAALLFILFMIQLIFVLKTDNVMPWFRMIAMLALAVTQFFTFPLLRKMQTNDAYYYGWCKKNNTRREFWLKWVYFRFLIVVNASNLVFVYIFSHQYYEVDALKNGDDRLRVSYAMAFAGAAIFTMSLSQLVISYAVFDHLREPIKVEMSEKSLE